MLAARAFGVLGGTSALLLALAAGTLGCRASASRAPSHGDESAPSALARVATFEGMCDASGAVEIDAQRFVVIDDEDNLLRTYDAERGGPPLSTVDLSRHLALEERDAEADLEAATRVGDKAYFLASHARTAKGARDAHRLLFFATTLPDAPEKTEVVGRPYRSLLDDLVEHPSLARFALREAAEKAPKEPGGLNLEGLTSESDGSLLLGFRNPIPGGHALLIRLLNPSELMEGKKPAFSEPIQIDLGGLGIRALTSWRSSLYILAGPSGDGGPFRLFRFDGKTKVEAVPNIDFTGFGPEGFFTPDARESLLVLSDDGTRLVNGTPCKHLKERALKNFRGVWIDGPRAP